MEDSIARAPDRTAPRHDSPIDDASAALAIQISELGGAVSELHRRLAPVLSPLGTIAGQVGQDKDDPARSPHTDQLYVHKDKVADIHSEVSAILGSLEI